MRRVAVREYSPAIGLIVSWLILFAALGHADAVRLAAAWTFVRGSRLLTGTNALAALRRRADGSGGVPGADVRRALRVELVALGGALLVLGLVVLLFWSTGEPRIAMLCALLAAGLPPRFLLPLVGGRASSAQFRQIASWSGTLLVAATALLAPRLELLALAFAARDWVALVVLALAGRPVRPKSPSKQPVGWQEIAQLSLARARRRMVYIVAKGALTAMLGPAGGLAARTGRGLKLHARFDRFAPRHPASLALLAAATVGVAIALVLLLPTPGFLLVAGSLFIVAAVAASVLFWSRIVMANPGDAAEDDEDDDG